MIKKKNRNYCINLLKEYTRSESLLKHAFAVEACVRAYAEKFNEDIEYWGNVALLHDFDYEKFPSAEQHPFKGAEILRDLGFSEDFVSSILSHADYTGVKRETLLQKTLFACDELAGFLIAVTYVRPSKKIDEVELSSVIKKMKDKAFAKSVNRQDIISGAAELGFDLSEHISFCIQALKKTKFL
jgi:putative nucleotidyltransferase with HDIG domain